MVRDLAVARLMAMMTRAAFLLSIVAAPMLGADGPAVLFSDSFKDFYPVVIAASAGSWHDLPQEPATAIASPHHAWIATIRRTDGAEVPYDKSLGRIEVTGDGEPTTVIQVHGFRTVSVTWINDRLLHIDLGLGRIAGVEAIYDLEDRRWIYQDSLSYPETR